MGDLAVNLDKKAVGSAAYMDLAFGPTGDLVVTESVGAISQAVTLRLNAFAQDFFLAMDDGLDYYGELLTGRRGLTPAFEAAMQNCVLQTPGIIGLLSWSSAFNSAQRSLSVKFEAQCSGGTVSFSVPVGLAEQ